MHCCSCILQDKEEIYGSFHIDVFFEKESRKGENEAGKFPGRQDAPAKKVLAKSQFFFGGHRNLPELTLLF